MLHLLDDGLVGLSSLHGQLAGQQKIAAVAVGDLHHFAAVAEIDYVFLQNDFHLKLSNDCGRRGHQFAQGPAPIFTVRDQIATSRLVPCGKRQQGDVAGLLDGAGQAALVRGANAGEPPGHNLAALGHKPLQQANIAVRDGVDLLGAELADLLAAEELAAAARTTG